MLSIFSVGMSRIRFIYLVGLFLFPFIYWPWSQRPFEVPRVHFFIFWVELLCVLYFFARRTNGGKIRFNSGLLVSVLVFLGTAIVSSFFGVDFNKSFWGNYLREDGLLTLVHLVGFSVITALIWRDKSKDILFSTISASNILMSLWTVLGGFLVFILRFPGITYWPNNALAMSFGNPNLLAGYLLVSSPFTMHLFRKAEGATSRILVLAALFLNVIAIGLTQSWGGVFGVLLLFVLTSFYLSHAIRYVLLIIAFILLSFGGLLYIQRQSVKGFLPEGRERIIRRSLVAVGKKPLLGWGWANVDYALENSIWPIFLDHDVYIDKAHGIFLEAAVTTGIAGLIPYIALVLIMSGRLLLRRRIGWIKPILLCFILYLFHAQTNVISIGEEIYFWVILGLLYVN